MAIRWQRLTQPQQPSDSSSTPRVIRSNLSLAAPTLATIPDTIAAIAGSLAGALKGFSAIPSDLYARFRAANLHEFDVDELAKGLTKIAEKRLGTDHAKSYS
ncbi:ADP-ribosylglycohydrolase family protein [Chloroflexi bacterium TSY]|nr:ADP-ribosylglycohydrolase family protein [Chloroflexi bacterium TSY]